MLRSRQPAPPIARPFRVLTDATNMVTDPRVTDMATYNPFNVSRTYDTSWPWAFNGQPVNGIHLYNPTAQDSYVEIGSGTQAMGMQGGTHLHGVDGRAPSDPSSAESGLGAQRALVMHTYRPNVGYQIWISDKLPNVPGRRPVSLRHLHHPRRRHPVVPARLHGGSSGTITWAKPRVNRRPTGTRAPTTPTSSAAWVRTAPSTPTPGPAQQTTHPLDALPSSAAPPRS